MEALGGGGGFLGWNFSQRKPKPFKSQSRKSKPADSAEATGGSVYRFPLKQAATAGSLALTGDTIAQLIQRWRKQKASEQQHSLSRSEQSDKDVLWTALLDHDWLRALRMTSYGFLLYGPGSYVWYQYLDHCMPNRTVGNLMMKVLLNQIVLGPCVIAVCFAWNNLWQGTVSELPNKYKKYALPTLLYGNNFLEAIVFWIEMWLEFWVLHFNFDLFAGFRFWIPVSILNFWVVPLQARVAFMSMGSIFWNFYLSSTMSK